MLITNARVFCLDEVSTGLDSAITFHIFNALRSICHSMNTSRRHRAAAADALRRTACSTTSSSCAMGDRVPRQPAERQAVVRGGAGLRHPEREDEAGFIVDYLTNPQLLLDNQKRKEERKKAPAGPARGVAQRAEVRDEPDRRREGAGRRPPSPSPPSPSHPPATPTTRTASRPLQVRHQRLGRDETEEMVSRYHASSYYQELLMDAQAGRKVIETATRATASTPRPGRPSRWTSTAGRSPTPGPRTSTWPSRGSPSCSGATSRC